MPNAWVFQADPRHYLVDDALRNLPEQMWLVQQHRNEVRAGDKAFIWRCGKNAAMLGRGIVKTDPADIEPNPAELKFLAQPLRFDGKRCRVTVQTEKFSVPLTVARMQTDPVLSSWYFLKGLQGTNFRVMPEIEAAIERMLLAGQQYAQA